MIKVVLPLVEDVISVDIKDTMRETVLDEEEDEVVVIVMMIQVVRVIPIDIEDTEEEAEAIHIEGAKEDIVIVMIQVDQVIQEQRIGDREDIVVDIVVDIVRNQVIHALIHLIVKVQVNHHQGKVNNIR